MWLTCSGEKLPQAGQEHMYEAEFRKASYKNDRDASYQRSWLVTSCEEKNLQFSESGDFIR